MEKKIRATPKPKPAKAIDVVVPKDVLVSQLRPNDTFGYGGAQYQVLSTIITVQDLKTGATGQIHPSTLVERL